MGLVRSPNGRSFLGLSENPGPSTLKGSRRTLRTAGSAGGAGRHSKARHHLVGE